MNAVLDGLSIQKLVGRILTTNDGNDDADADAVVGVVVVVVVIVTSRTVVRIFINIIYV